MAANVVTGSVEIGQKCPACNITVAFDKDPNRIESSGP